jgi:hypothetical protein
VTLGAALLTIVCFALALEKLGIFRVALRAVKSGRDASHVLRNSVMSDDQKEREVRALSLVLLRCFGSISVRAVAAVAASVVPLWLLHTAGIVRISAVNELLVSWRGVVLASVAIGAVHVARTRL